MLVLMLVRMGCKFAWKNARIFVAAYRMHGMVSFVKGGPFDADAQLFVRPRQVRTGPLRP